MNVRQGSLATAYDTTSEERAVYFTTQDYLDSFGRCERMGEYVPENELISVVADNGVELLLCPNCVAEINER